MAPEDVEKPCRVCMYACVWVDIRGDGDTGLSGNVCMHAYMGGVKVSVRVMCGEQ